VFVLLLLGVIKGKEAQNSCLVSVFFYFLSVLLHLVGQKPVALDEKKFSFALSSFARGKSDRFRAGRVW